MDRHHVAVATMTLVRDERDDRRMRQSLTALARHGMQVAATDGGSGDSFTQFATSLPAFAVLAPPNPPGLVAQVRTSLETAAAWGTPFLLYTEPDKTEFFDRALMSFIADAPADDDVGIVIACRSPAALRTFPAFQQYTEGTINRLCSEITGVDADYSYGPFLMNRQLVRYMARVTPEIGWGWRHFLFGLARRLGLRIVAVAGDYECPPEQRDDDRGERLYRVRQLGENVSGLLLSQKGELHGSA